MPRKAKLYAALADDAESLSAGMIVADFRRSDYQQWERYTQTFTPAESGNYHFGFYAYSSSTDDSCIDLWLAYFEVQNDEIVPMPVSDLAISFGTDSAVEATLSWTLPTEDTEGFALDAARQCYDMDRFRSKRNDSRRPYIRGRGGSERRAKLSQQHHLYVATAIALLVRL